MCCTKNIDERHYLSLKANEKDKWYVQKWSRKQEKKPNDWMTEFFFFLLFIYAYNVW
jgi:hypothetical protein